jgi:hypothetical protein
MGDRASLDGASYDRCPSASFERGSTSRGGRSLLSLYILLVLLPGLRLCGWSWCCWIRIVSLPRSSSWSGVRSRLIGQWQSSSGPCLLPNVG